MEQNRIRLTQLDGLAALALVIGAYLAAPWLMMLWIHAIPPLQAGMTMEGPLYGTIRWMAVIAVALGWQLIANNRGSAIARYVLWLASSLILIQIGTAAVLALSPSVWEAPDELSYYISPIAAHWTRLIAIPINLLTQPFGIDIGFHTNGRPFFNNGPMWNATDVPDVPIAYALHWALCLLAWLVAGLLLWKVVGWFWRRRNGDGASDRHARRNRIGWTAFLFLPYYVETAQYTWPVDQFEAARNIVALLIFACILLVTAIILTPLYILLARGASDQVPQKRTIILIGIISILALLLVGSGRIRKLTGHNDQAAYWPTTTKPIVENT
jgi:uncharacterized membrane protein (DUF485 family)